MSIEQIVNENGLIIKRIKQSSFNQSKQEYVENANVFKRQKNNAQ